MAANSESWSEVHALICSAKDLQQQAEHSYKALEEKCTAICMAAREVVDNQKLVVSCSEWLLQHIENKDAHCADLQKSLSSYGEENTEVLFGNIEKFDKAAGGLLCHFEEANDQSKLVFDEMSERVDGAWDESFRDLGVHAARFDLKYFASEDICQRTSDLERIFKDMFETTTSTDEQKNSEAKIMEAGRHSTSGMTLRGGYETHANANRRSGRLATSRGSSNWSLDESAMDISNEDKDSPNSTQETHFDTNSTKRLRVGKAMLRKGRTSKYHADLPLAASNNWVTSNHFQNNELSSESSNDEREMDQKKRKTKRTRNDDIDDDDDNEYVEEIRKASISDSSDSGQSTGARKRTRGASTKGLHNTANKLKQFTTPASRTRSSRHCNHERLGDHGMVDSCFDSHSEDTQLKLAIKESLHESSHITLTTSQESRVPLQNGSIGGDGSASSSSSFCNSPASDINSFLPTSKRKSTSGSSPESSMMTNFVSTGKRVVNTFCGAIKIASPFSGTSSSEVQVLVSDDDEEEHHEVAVSKSHMISCPEVHTAKECNDIEDNSLPKISSTENRHSVPALRKDLDLPADYRCSRSQRAAITKVDATMDSFTRNRFYSTDDAEQETEIQNSYSSLNGQEESFGQEKSSPGNTSDADSYHDPKSAQYDNNRRYQYSVDNTSAVGGGPNFQADEHVRDTESETQNAMVALSPNSPVRNRNNDSLNDINNVDMESDGEVIDLT